MAKTEKGHGNGVLIVWALAKSRGIGHCSLLTRERVFSEYYEDLILLNCLGDNYTQYLQQ